MSFARNHVGELERFEIGLLVARHQGIWGFVTQEARERGVSRWFIYWCSRQVAVLLLWWQLKGSGSAVSAPLIGSVPEAILSLYLEGEASLSGIAHSLQTLLGEQVSVGTISGVLEEQGSRLPAEEPCGGRPLSFVPDELFVQGQPLLVTVEPQSGYILQLRLAERRDEQSWRDAWQKMEGGVPLAVKAVIADLARGLAAARVSSLPGADAQADHWHLLNPLCQRLRVLERQGYAAIGREEKARKAWVSQQQEREKAPLREAWQGTCQQALSAMKRSDDGHYLLGELRQQLMLIDPERGELRVLEQVERQVGAALALMAEIDEELLQKKVRCFRQHLPEALTYLRYSQSVGLWLQQHVPQEEIRQALLLQYHYQGLLRWVDGKPREELKRELFFWQDALRQALGEEEWKRLSQEVRQRLDEIIRSSSIVETTNSRLRRFTETSRGQLTQERLNLIRFYLNHKPFERGRRAGKTAAQLFAGQQGVPPHWLEVLRLSLRQQQKPAL